MLCFCGAKMNRLIINGNEFYRCSSCGYLKKTDILKPVDEKKRYDSHICDEGYLKYMNSVYNKLLPLLEDGASIDYGCGKIHALADIMNSNNKKCDYYDLYYFDKEIKGPFKNIILIEVFEHIKEPLELLSYLKSLLLDGGAILIMTQIVKEPLDKWWYLRDTTHISFFTPEAMEALAKRLDMRLIYNKADQIFKLSKKN